MTVSTTYLWEELSIPLANFIKKRVPIETDAEDILQEVFIKIHNSIEDLKDDRKIHAWVYRITRNAIVDYYRKSKPNHSIELSEVSYDLTTDSCEDLTLNLEIAACLKTMIESLPEKYKQALLLTGFENLTQKELSEKTGLSLSGAKSRVQRGRKLLQQMLLGCCHVELDRCGNIIDYQHKSSDCKYC